MIHIKSKNQIEKMVRAASVVKNLLNEIDNMIKPGITTLDLDQFAENFILQSGAVPGFKGLYGFPFHKLSLFINTVPLLVFV